MRARVSLASPKLSSSSFVLRNMIQDNKEICRQSASLNWSPSLDCCQWKGIGCDAQDRVNRLWLPSSGLSGGISPSILNLTRLAQLNLSHNWLSDPLPDGFFTSLNLLQIVDLSFNRLSGPPLPSGSLPVTVQTLNLSSNHFVGTIQSSFLQQALNLVSFNISNNSFTGQIPSSICRNSPSLVLLDFSFNEFDSQLPQGFGDCSKLEHLRAGFNNLSGPLPDDIYSAGSLQEISMPGNKLYGPIGEGVVNLTSLRILELQGNEFNSTLPEDIGKLSNLEQLLLHINSFTGTLPPSLMNCTSLKKLILRVNSLVGELSTLDFSNLQQLGTIDLGNNLFNGSLPRSLFLCKSLTAMRLAGNQLKGEISPDILALDSLSFLSLSNNSLTNVTGAINILMGFKNLSTIILSKNFFNETLPSTGSIVHPDGFQNLQILGLGGCNFTGDIPTWLSKLEKLKALDLSFNRFAGSIPGWFGNLPSLFYLDLSINFFDGDFPSQLIGLQSLVSQQGANMVNSSYLELPVFVQPNDASNLQYNQLSNLPPAIYLNNNSLS
ncbi:hypothetical protein RJ639_034779, partial [Escallonia herrerae]